MPQFEYSPADSAQDMPALARILSHAFAFPPEDTAPWLERAGIGNCRVMRDGSGTPQACLLLIPMGQFFGGKSVRMTGVAAVGVAPEARGRGIATSMMREALSEIHRSGVPLSCLFPATQPLYRRLGYEQAGHRFEIRVPLVRLQDLGKVSSDLEVVPFTSEMLGEVKACYAQVAPGLDGHLDRGEYVWARVQNPRQTPASGFVLRGSAGIEGYVFLRQERPSPTSRHEIAISDWCAATADAGRRLLGFLSEFGSMGEELSCFGGPSLPILMHMAEQRHVIRLRDHWMLRLIDAAGAFRARGFPQWLSTEVHFDIADDLIAENAGPRILRIERGSATLEPGGQSSIQIDTGALASWYSGYATLRTLRRLGRVKGGDEAISAADGVIAGTTPWMPDMF